MLLALLLLAVAQPSPSDGAAGTASPPATEASAPAADASAFTRQCAAKGPADICACMADELQRGRDDQVVLETYAIATLPEAERKPAMAIMMERYKLTQAELGPIGNAVTALLDAALKACDE